MHAARLHRYDPEFRGPDYLVIDEVPDPAIREADDVIVRIDGAGLCRTDLHIIEEKIIIGNLVGRYADLLELMTLAGEGKVRLAVTYYPLEQINQAIRDLHEGKVKGRAVLLPGGAA
mgnify:CR=1 FL=1